MIKSSVATQRAEMPEGTQRVLDRRTVDNDNRNLLPLLTNGSSVLDVGCGSGAITKGIAEKTGPEGRVMGIDPNESLIALANKNYAGIPQLQFKVADINTFTTAERYGIVTSARVLQWLPNPKAVLSIMKGFLEDNGVLAILDYNHEKIRWDPAPPVAMQVFYDAFLAWRKDAGFDNTIADHLSGMMAELGFREIHVGPQQEMTRRADADFTHRARIWSEVAETRGHQMVKDGYITGAERLAAIQAYDAWVAYEGKSMELYLLGVEGRL